MGLPLVVVGMAVYLALSRSGPLGSWGLLFTPQAMVIAQMILVAPIVAALTRQTIEDLWTEYRDELPASAQALRRRATAAALAPASCWFDRCCQCRDTRTRRRTSCRPAVA